MPTSDRTPKRILLIRTDRFGDLLMTLPIVRRLRSNFPQAKITVLCASVNEPLLHYHLDITDIQTVHPDHLKFNNLPTFFRKIIGMHPDCIVMPQSNKWYHLAAFLSGASIRIGFKRKWGFLLTNSISDTKAESGLHEIDSNMKLLDLLCAKPWDKCADLGFETCEEAFEIPEKLGIRQEKISIAFHMSSSNPVKQWPIGSFKKVMDHFLKRGRYQVVLVGSEKTDEMRRLLNFNPEAHVVDLLGKTNFKELALILRSVKCLVSLDSGPLHLAWMQGTPVVGIFIKGAVGSNPTRWGVYPGIVPNKQFYDPAEALAPSMVIEAVEEITAVKRGDL